MRTHRVNWFLQFHRDQTGASYSVSVLITIPILIVYLLATVETALLFHSYLSLKAATQIAGRTAKAWWLHRDAIQSESLDLHQVIRRTTSRNMMAFAATGTREIQASESVVQQKLSEIGMSDLASQRYGRKAEFINEMTRVTVSVQQKSVQGVLVRVEYDSPLWFPLFASLLATGQNTNGYYRTISTEVWVPVADGEIELTSYGIPYSPSAATTWIDDES